MPVEGRGGAPARRQTPGPVTAAGSWQLDEPEDRWPGDPAEPAGVASVVVRCHLLGADEQLLLHGAGNFSVKTQARDHLDRPVPALAVSGWGADARTIRPCDFSVLRLDQLAELRGARMDSDREMVERLVRTVVDADQPRPAIETLVHAWLPARHVDHSHPDAIIALSAAPDGRALVSEAFGDAAVWFDYRQFGPAAARELAELVASAPAARIVVLANHGLLAWGDDSRACYRRTVAAARTATRLLAARRGGPPGAPPVPAAARRAALRAVLPALRDALAGPGERVVLRADAGERTAAFAASRAAVEASLRGPACPDHLTHTKARPAVVDAPGQDRGGAAVQAAVERYRHWHAGYCARHAGPGGSLPAGADDRPRVVVLRDVGVVTAGRDLDDADRTLEMFRQSMRVIGAALGAGGYRTLDEAACFADEHWWLQRDKPARFGRRAPLRGWVVVVDGGGSPWGADLAEGLSRRGACVVAGPVAPPPGGGPSAVEQAVLRHGGVDAVVSPGGAARGHGPGAPGPDAELVALLGERAAGVLRVRVDGAAASGALRVERSPGPWSAVAPPAGVAGLVALALGGGAG